MRQGSESSRRATNRSEVEGGLVGPLEVFEHHHGGVWGSGQLGEHGVEDGGLVAGREGVGERTGPPAGDVGQRAERPGGEQVVAAAHQHLGVADVVVDHLLHEGRLAGPRFAADQHEVAAAVEPREPLGDRRHLLGPLEEVHAVGAYDSQRGTPGCPSAPGRRPDRCP